MRMFLPSLVQPGLSSPPRDCVTIFGDGTAKGDSTESLWIQLNDCFMINGVFFFLAGVFVSERDVAAFTIMAVDDPRALNKVVYLRPPGNVYSMNELVGIWEGKIGKKLEKVFVSEQELLRRIHGNENLEFFLF